MKIKKFFALLIILSILLCLGGCSITEDYAYYLNEQEAIIVYKGKMYLKAEMNQPYVFGNTRPIKVLKSGADYSLRPDNTFEEFYISEDEEYIQYAYGKSGINQKLSVDLEFELTKDDEYVVFARGHRPSISHLISDDLYCTVSQNGEYIELMPAPYTPTQFLSTAFSDRDWYENVVITEKTDVKIDINLFRCTEDENIIVLNEGYAYCEIDGKKGFAQLKNNAKYPYTVKFRPLTDEAYPKEVNFSSGYLEGEIE